jgi:hypothetical protein
MLLMLALVAAPAIPCAAAQDGDLDLELNNVQQVPAGCRVTFVTINQLGADLDKMSVEIGVFDEKGIFSDMVVFDFGRLPKGKTKVVQYDLARKCTTISRLLFNSVNECSSEKDMRQVCENKIKTRSLVNISFGQ